MSAESALEQVSLIYSRDLHLDSDTPTRNLLANIRTRQAGRTLQADGAGHLNEQSSITEFPLLCDKDIISIIHCSTV